MTVQVADDFGEAPFGHEDAVYPAFARAYLFSATGIKPPSGFQAIELPVGQLFVTKDTSFYLVEDGTDCVLIIGYCIDLDQPQVGEEALGRRIPGTARKKGIKAAAIENEDLFGRFAVIVAVDGDLGAFSDATAMRTIYFSEDHPIVASHSTLIAEALDRTPRLSLFKAFRYGLPGNLSSTEGVRNVPGNFLLDMTRGKVERFWPRDTRQEQAEGEVYPLLRTALQDAARAIADRWHPTISLTAGIDSRVALASFRRFPHAATFTYLRDGEDERDAVYAPIIAKRVGLQHRVVRMTPADEHNDLINRIEAMPDHVHDPRIASIYARHFGDNKAIHCRSNLLEIGRSFWRKHPVMPRRFAPQNWPLVSVRKAGSLPDLDEETVSSASKLMTAEMQSFFELAEYCSDDPYNPELLGYDAWDLVYWEHRMSTWHAQILLASDYTFDTAVIFNNRRFLRALLSLPTTSRKDHSLLLRYIGDEAPELQGYPINPRMQRPPVGAILPALKRRVLRLMRS